MPFVIAALTSPRFPATAIALENPLHLVTRNENDFVETCVAIVNPRSS
ncbi:MAG: hypothetical protein SW833_01390 [Cyanobacteriota bacterium]|nr:hypothetical protein [Cyanobacteriota bacterium]